MEFKWNLILLILATASPIIDQPCEGKKNGDVADESHCLRFYKCNHGRIVARIRCPSGSGYSKIKNKCDWLANVDCDSRPINWASSPNVKVSRLWVKLFDSTERLCLLWTTVSRLLFATDVYRSTRIVLHDLFGCAESIVIIIIIVVIYFTYRIYIYYNPWPHNTIPSLSTPLEVHLIDSFFQNLGTEVVINGLPCFFSRVFKSSKKVS